MIDYAQLMGITAKLDPYLSLAIGSSGVHPLEMASAYGTFANGGIHVDTCAITKVTNSRGETIQDYLPEGRRVISERTNAMIDECLRGVVAGRGGTGFRAGGVPGARGKTGTTNDDRDAWFIGYVPGKLAAACWIGNDNYAPMRRAYGGFVGAPIWKEFMLKALPVYEKIHSDEDKAAKNAIVHKQAPANSPDQPEDKKDTGKKADVNAADDSDTVTLRICDDSQLLATRYCPSSHTETFARGSEPTSYCTMHGPGKTPAPARDNTQQGADSNYQQLTTVTVCRDSGLLATRYCPHKITKRVPEDQVPTQTCNIHTGRE